MSLNSGHIAEVVSAEEKVKFDVDFPTVKGIDLIRLQPDGWLHYDTFLKHANDIYNFKFHPADVLLMTVPKSGTTWTQNLVYNMRHNKNLTADVDSMVLHLLSPQIDLDYFFDSPSGLMIKEMFWKNAKDLKMEVDPDGPILLQVANQMKGDIRTLKTHLPFSLLPKNLLDTCKVIYVARNPKDVCVSYHHHCKLLRLHDYQGSFDDFVDYFLSGSVYYLPYWPHLKEAHSRKGHPNLHIVYFEDLKKDTKAEVRKLNEFLGTNLTETQMDNIIQQNNFANMKEKQNESMKNEDMKEAFSEKVFEEEGGTVRKGIVGDSKNKLSKEQLKRFDKWIAENTQGVDIHYK